MICENVVDLVILINSMILLNLVIFVNWVILQISESSDFGECRGSVESFDSGEFRDFGESGFLYIW